jgi:hypothetical protein
MIEYDDGKTVEAALDRAMDVLNKDSTVRHVYYTYDSITIP